MIIDFYEEFYRRNVMNDEARVLLVHRLFCG